MATACHHHQERVCQGSAALWAHTPPRGVRAGLALHCVCAGRRMQALYCTDGWLAGMYAGAPNVGERISMRQLLADAVNRDDNLRRWVCSSQPCWTTPHQSRATAAGISLYCLPGLVQCL